MNDLQQSGSQLFVRSGKKILKVKMEDIFILEGNDHFVKILTIHKKHYMSRSRLKDIEAKITGHPGHPFCRVNRSYIVNLNHIDEVNDNVIQMGPVTVCLQKAYYVLFFQKPLVV